MVCFPGPVSVCFNQSAAWAAAFALSPAGILLSNRIKRFWLCQMVILRFRAVTGHSATILPSLATRMDG